jgi:hypothetical protein
MLLSMTSYILLNHFFQDDIIARAVNQVVSQGIAYFSPAGNAARNMHHPASFQLTSMALRFISLALTSMANQCFLSALQCAQGSRSELDILFLINGQVVPMTSDYNMGPDAVKFYFYTFRMG